jgi:predicted PurR-regulated permease PerM
MPQTLERERLFQLLFYGAQLLLGYLLYRIVQPFLVELGWAAVLAICLQPFYDPLARRFGRGRAAFLSTLIVLVLLVAPAVFVARALITEGSRAVGEMQEALKAGQGTERIQAVWAWVERWLPVPLPPLEDVKATLVSKVGGVATFLAARAGSVARDALVFAFDLVVVLLAFFFLLRDGDLVSRAVRRILPFDDGHKDRLINLTRDLVSVSVTASLLVGLLQGLLGGVTFALLGIHAAVLWGVVMAVASLIPVVGSGLVWLPTALWLLASGEVARGVILVAVGAVVIGNVDNVVRPWLLAGRSTMNGLVIFISLMGGVSAFGLIGLVLGPLVVATVTALLETYTSEEAPSPPPIPAALEGGKPTP